MKKKRFLKFNIITAIFIIAICIIGKVANSFAAAQSAEEQQVGLSFAPKPLIDIALVKSKTDLDLKNYKDDIIRELERIGVDTSEVKVTAVDAIVNELSSQSLNFDKIVNSWEKIGADTWTATNGQIYSRTGGGQSKPAWWGTGLLDPDGYEATEYHSTFTMVTGGALNEGVCFNVTKNADGSLNGYFVSICNHLNTECRLWRFDHYTLDQSFSTRNKCKYVVPSFYTLW